MKLNFLGSYHYVTHPIIPLTQTVATLNLDMIGRDENDANCHLVIQFHFIPAPCRTVSQLAAVDFAIELEPGLPHQDQDRSAAPRYGRFAFSVSAQ